MVVPALLARGRGGGLEGGGLEGANVTEAVAHLVLQVAVILIAAKAGSELFERGLRQPGVLGELVAGVIIGPYVLGGALFHQAAGPGRTSAIPVSLELWALAQIGAVILLFYSGLETDLDLFFRYGAAATATATGGVILPFALGDLMAVVFGLAPSPLGPAALFTGAIMTATSVGISARVLRDAGKLGTPEGVTILAGAVIDDVLGILALAVAVSLTTAGQVSPGGLALIAGKAIGFWLALMAAGLLLSRWISRLLASLQSPGSAVSLTLALGFLAAALAEQFGLAMIIGAYTMGLALSNMEVGETLRGHVESVSHILVPVFFVVMGMLLDFEAVGGVLGFGLAISALAIAGKVLGCGLPALAVGFNHLGALRIGVGAMPRGEVALIVAGVGLSSGVIGADLFGVAIMMTFITTLLAPPLLVPLFQHDGPGTRG